jgi:pimeloyl-ACP methyl ester carboxylesterase
MKLAVAPAAACIPARAGSATGPGTSPTPPGLGVAGPVRRALNVAAVVFFAACGGDGNPIQVTNGSIRGTVTDNTGATVANAAVALTGSAQAARTTNSGADGVYTFTDVPSGTYTLAVTPPSGFAVGAAGTASVTVAGGAQADAPAIVLDRAPPATLSGVVRSATGAVVAGASVSVGSVTATTGADGRFELLNVPSGAATITTSAPRFDQRVESITLNEGANVHDVVLTQQTVFMHQNVLAYLPPGKAEYRAAIVFLPGLRDPSTGNPLDSRRLVGGTPGTGCSIWCVPPELEEVKRRSLELAGGNVALVGTTPLLDDPADYEKLLQALSQLGAQGLHPELASIPILFVGHSQGGCTAYGFTRAHAARVAGFVTMKGGCHNPGPPGAATTVPGFFLIGRLDAPHRTANITPVFEAGRAAGAPWSLSIDAFGHGPIVDFDLMFDWIGAVLTARLPATAGAPLRPMTETAGWLGNRSTGAIATYACYSSTRSSASWLPSRTTALGWQRMAGGTGVVSSC